METSVGPRLWLLTCLAVFVSFTVSTGVAYPDGHSVTYIVQLSNMGGSSEQMQLAMIGNLLGLDEGEDALDCVLYNYVHAFKGFAAKLTSSQVEILAKRDEILAITTEVKYDLHTTRTPKLLRLRGKHGAWNLAPLVHDVIVGVFDTGVWPESGSYKDNGICDVPARWKGVCEESADFNTSNCNKKLIGARSFYKSYEADIGTMNETKSARDTDGHGSHISSTAAGSCESHASLYGYAPGTACGAANTARISVYKVCWAEDCMAADVLAGMESAIVDGVDIMSLSLGTSKVLPYHEDPVAIAAFSAVQKGIFVSISAGNSGPAPMSVVNVAPWMTTVGAGTLDRDFPAMVVLGNGEHFHGVSLYGGKRLPKNKFLPLILATDAGKGNSSSSLCLENTLDEAKVKGKIVICERGIIARVAKGYVVKSAGGLGMILCNSATNGDSVEADSHFLPATMVGYSAKKSIDKYMKTTRNPNATIDFNGTKVAVKPSPVVASFSSRGPNPVTPEILKPDIIAPGVNILAAWTGTKGPSGMEIDMRRVKFNIISGTSMSSPLVSGIAAIVKAVHPPWSPAAIRSALMTTAYTVDNTGKPFTDEATRLTANPFDYGSGHVNAVKALDPGLIYDMATQDYVDHLCALHYSISEITTITGSNATCSRKVRRRNLGNLNYPCFSVVFPNSTVNTTIKYTRTVTNVGGAAATYNCTFFAPPTVKMMVRPKRLSFNGSDEKQSYSLSFTSKVSSTRIAPTPNSGWLAWTDGVHHVKSSIAFSWKE